MKRAIMSDIHANTEALKAVLDDIERRGIEDVICLGDVVGYGPEPAECIRLVHEGCRVTMMGNHDYALLTVPYGFNPVAAQAIHCHRSKLESGCMNHEACGAHLEFLKERPTTHVEDGVLYVHASPRDPLVEYVLESDVAYGAGPKITGMFERMSEYGAGVCFVGHSHRPGVVTPDFRWLRPGDEPDEANGLDVTNAAHIVNDGSVGQPRDGDPRACYVEWDDGAIFFRRVEYPFRLTMKKIEESGCLHSYCGERLAEGK